MIFIDGLDISTVKLARLSRALTIIPPDLSLFSRTLRSNLNLYGDKSDGKLHSVLQQVRLVCDSQKDKGFANLDMLIRPGGTGISHGQRQFVCLARALLARCRLLILDEATSAMDNATDAAIQQVVRSEFSEATAMVIAHKLATVADFGSILVLSHGKVAEFGPPAELIAKGGPFSDMMKQSDDEE